MSPETVQAITAVATILDRLGALPIGTIMVLVILGPWVFSFITNRLQEKRFDAITKMYENNVKLVESYEKLSSAQSDVITINTAKWAEAIDRINTNQFCPLARNKKIRMEDISG